MGWENASHDEIERGLGHFFGLSAAGLANACEVIVEADRAQLFFADGSPDMVQWLSARYGLAHRTARRLVETARWLVDLPKLNERFRSGELSFDRVEAIARMATPDSEEALIEEAMGRRWPGWSGPPANPTIPRRILYGCWMTVTAMCNGPSTEWQAS